MTSTNRIVCNALAANGSMSTWLAMLINNGPWKYIERMRTDKAKDCLARYKKAVYKLAEANRAVAQDYAAELADAERIIAKIERQRSIDDWDAWHAVEGEARMLRSKYNRWLPKSVTDAERIIEEADAIRKSKKTSGPKAKSEDEWLD